MAKIIPILLLGNLQSNFAMAASASSEASRGLPWFARVQNQVVYTSNLSSICRVSCAMTAVWFCTHCQESFWIGFQRCAALNRNHIALSILFEPNRSIPLLAQIAAVSNDETLIACKEAWQFRSARKFSPIFRLVDPLHSAVG